MAIIMRAEPLPAKMLRIRQAADYLGLSRETVRHFCNIGKLKSCRTPGNHRRISERDLVDFKKAMEKAERARERFEQRNVYH